MQWLKNKIKQWLYGDELYTIPVHTIYYNDFDKLIFKLPEDLSNLEVELFTTSLKETLKKNTKMIITTKDIKVLHLVKTELDECETSSNYSENVQVGEQYLECEVQDDDITNDNGSLGEEPRETLHN